MITPLPRDFFSVTFTFFFFFCLYLAFQLTLHALWGGFGFLSHFCTVSSLAGEGQAFLDSSAIIYEDRYLSCI